jgi:hypothetical protein
MRSLGIGVFAYLFSITMWASIPLPTLIQAPVDKVFVITDGFDSNDNVQVVVKGNFRNSCYRADKGSAEIDRKTNTIRVSATAYYYPQDICIEMLVPYIQVIKVGILEVGDYKVVPEGTGNEQLARTFHVKEATTTDSDDHLYTPVTSAFVDTDLQGRQILHMQGQYPLLYRGCMKTQQVAVYLTPDNVLVVQPIAAILPQEDCGSQSGGTFNISQPLAQRISGEVLIHIRTLNGNAYNQLMIGK